MNATSVYLLERLSTDHLLKALFQSRERATRICQAIPNPSSGNPDDPLQPGIKGKMPFKVHDHFPSSLSHECRPIPRKDFTSLHEVGDNDNDNSHSASLLLQSPRRRHSDGIPSLYSRWYHLLPLSTTFLLRL